MAEAKRQLGSRMTWLCDSIDNDLKHALGNAPNSEFIVDPDGRIVVSRQWSNPTELRKDLARLVGEVTPATTIAEVGMKPLQPPKTAPRGIVPRLSLPGNLTPVKVEPLSNKDDEPFYVKLRAEVDQAAFRGDGKLYLGFFLDPLYKVHWNNTADPITFEIESTRGVTVSETSAEGPKVEAPADADPREFLLDVFGGSGSSLTLTVYYVACDDAETFCKPVKQQYKVTLTRDQDGGSRRTSKSRGGSPGRNPYSRMDVESMARMMQSLPVFRALDGDGDGELSAEELNRASAALKRVDRNRDGVLSRDELRPRPQGFGPGRTRSPR